jgi:hypothetical protein
VESLLAQTFCTFFDNWPMQYTLDFCSELAQVIPSYDLAFLPTADVVGYVQDLDVGR